MAGTKNDHQRPERRFAALARLSDRHAGNDELLARTRSLATVEPRDVVRLVELLAGGTATYAQGEEPIGPQDLSDALTLVPQVRVELDETELGLIVMARGRGLTWINIAEVLGLGSAQAAQQRHDRLAARVEDQHPR